MTQRTKSVMPPRAQRRNLSLAAYEKELAAARAWKERNRERVRASWYDTCACGRRKAHDSARCVECRKIAERAVRDARCRQIEQWWAEGVSCKEIARRLGWTVGSFAREKDWMRKNGYSMPARKRGVVGVLA